MNFKKNRTMQVIYSINYKMLISIKLVMLLKLTSENFSPRNDEVILNSEAILIVFTAIRIYLLKILTK